MPTTPLRLSLVLLCVLSLPQVTAKANQLPEPPSTAPSVLAKIERYAERLLHTLDVNQNGTLDSEEWHTLAGDPARIDRNGDDAITADELVERILVYGRTRRLAGRDSQTGSAESPETSGSPPDSAETDSISAPGNGNRAAEPANEDSDTGLEEQRRNLKFYVRPERLPPNVPAWFLSRDSDGDAQLTLSEFTHEGAGRAEDFRKLDRNRDGLVTAAEVVAKDR